MERHDYTAIGETLYTDILPNGLRLLVAVKPGYTRCHAFFATKYGGADRRFLLDGKYIDTPAGVAHFLEHKMFDMPDGDNVIAALSANGAQPNAYTSSGITAYYFDSTDNFVDNLRMLLRFVSTPYFTDESVHKEQGIIGQEIRMVEDSPDNVIYQELMRCLYAANPVRDSVAGTVESIADITPEILYSCHRVFYTPGNMCLCVAGDVDPEKVRGAALELLPGASGEIPGRDYGPEETALPSLSRFARAMDVSAPQFLVGLKLRPIDGGNAILRRKIVCGLALSYLFGESSPFYLRLYREGLLNTDFSADMDSAAGTFTVLAGGESREPERVFDEVFTVLKGAAETIDEAYFTRVKRSSYGNRIRALASFGGLCASMADGAFEGYNCLDSFAVTDSVTPAELRDFIRDNLVPERMAMSVITPVSGKEAK